MQGPKPGVEGLRSEATVTLVIYGVLTQMSRVKA
jgi:hypothetical protein